MIARDYRVEALTLARELADRGLPAAEAQVRNAIAESSLGTEIAMKLRSWLWSVVEAPTVEAAHRARALNLIEYIDQLLA